MAEEVRNEETNLNGSLAGEASNDFDIYFPVLATEIANFEERTNLAQIMRRRDKEA